MSRTPWVGARWSVTLGYQIAFAPLSISIQQSNHKAISPYRDVGQALTGSGLFSCDCPRLLGLEENHAQLVQEAVEELGLLIGEVARRLLADYAQNVDRVARLG